MKQQKKEILDELKKKRKTIKDYFKKTRYDEEVLHYKKQIEAYRQEHSLSDAASKGSKNILISEIEVTSRSGKGKILLEKKVIVSGQRDLDKVRGVIHERGSNGGDLIYSPVDEFRRKFQTHHQSHFDKWNRMFDTESQLAEHLANVMKKIEKNPSALRGKVRIFSERPLCASCARLIKNEFKKTYQGIEVEIFEGYSGTRH